MGDFKCLGFWMCNLERVLTGCWISDGCVIFVPGRCLKDFVRTLDLGSEQKVRELPKFGLSSFGHWKDFERNLQNLGLWLDTNGFCEDFERIWKDVGRTLGLGFGILDGI